MEGKIERERPNTGVVRNFVKIKEEEEEEYEVEAIRVRDDARGTLMAAISIASKCCIYIHGLKKARREIIG